MDTEEIIAHMRQLIKSREDVMASIRRKRWRPSEKAMTLAVHHGHIEALEAAILMLSGPQFEGVKDAQINVRAVIHAGAITGYQLLDVERVEHEDDGSITAIIDAEKMTLGRKGKESSPEMSTLAGQMMAQCRRLIAEGQADDTPRTGFARVSEQFLRNVMRLCGSVIGQDETPGQHGAQEHSDVLRAAGVPSEGDGQEHSAIMDAIRGG